ncbi:hypothetical protein COCNU_08G001920 [Cocos nucifera]|uniref:Uncharacterized protein n=1 Tax=Cocos nucifera TaxID=13894 RepID=A0A8K0IIC4_COCNU|nr:hypothetical protein COCNU_08G001920 [Cocos nucifera]
MRKGDEVWQIGLGRRVRGLDEWPVRLTVLMEMDQPTAHMRHHEIESVPMNGRHHMINGHQTMNTISHIVCACAWLSVL